MEKERKPKRIKPLFLKDDKGRLYCTVCESTSLSIEKKPGGSVICNKCGSISRNRFS